MRDFYRTKEHDVFKIGNVDASCQHVNGNYNVRFRAIPKLADSLQWAIYAARNLLHERIALAENVASNIDKVIRV